MASSLQCWQILLQRWCWATSILHTPSAPSPHTTGTLPHPNNFTTQNEVLECVHVFDCNSVASVVDINGLAAAGHEPAPTHSWSHPQQHHPGWLSPTAGSTALGEPLPPPNPANLLFPPPLPPMSPPTAPTRHTARQCRRWRLRHSPTWQGPQPRRRTTRHCRRRRRCCQ